MKLSVVVMNRNDDYKEPKRAAFCVNSLLDTFDEVFYIDYNTEEGKESSLNTFIDDVPKTGKLKHIQIYPAYHHLMTNVVGGTQAQSVCEVIGKNIGIRRATGDWIVTTNIDIIGPENYTFRNLLSGLDSNRFYLISRRDVPLEKCNEYDVKDWKLLHDYLTENTGERHMCGAGQRGIIEKDCWGDQACEHEVEYPWGVGPNDVWSKVNCCGDWQFAHRDVWHDIRAHEERQVGKCFMDTTLQKKAGLMGHPVEVFYSPPVFHIGHKPSAKKINSTGMGGGTGATNNPKVWIDDFTKTMNHQDWGFPMIQFDEQII